MDATRNGAFITEEEQREILQANQSGSTPVVFVHGLWLLPSSWDRWADLFRRAGYATLTPGWPYGPETIEEAKAKRKFFKGMPIGEVADHFEQVIGVLNKRPVIIGHSFGGLLTEILAGRGLAAASVAISPARSSRVLPLFVSGVITIDPTIPSKLVALRPASPVPPDPATKHHAVPLRYNEFRYAFANAVDEDQAKRLYEQFCVPASEAETWPFEAASAANLAPFSEVKVDCKNPDRGPMLIIVGGKDHTVPIAISRTAFKWEQENEGTTEYVELPDRDHASVIDDNWQEVAVTALKFVGRFVSEATVTTTRRLALSPPQPRSRRRGMGASSRPRTAAATASWPRPVVYGFLARHRGLYVPGDVPDHLFERSRTGPELPPNAAEPLPNPCRRRTYVTIRTELRVWRPTLRPARHPARRDHWAEGRRGRAEKRLSDWSSVARISEGQQPERGPVNLCRSDRLQSRTRRGEREVCRH